MQGDMISRNAVFGLLLRIKAQASVAVLYETISKEMEDKVVDIVDMFSELIQNIPALDVAPVVHARWIEDGYRGIPCVCSHCGEEAHYKSTFVEQYFATDTTTHITHWMPLPEPPEEDE